MRRQNTILFPEYQHSQFFSRVLLYQCFRITDHKGPYEEYQQQQAASK